MYRNNPAFRIVHLDPELQAIKEYEQYYMNITRTGKITIVYNFVILSYSVNYHMETVLPKNKKPTNQQTNKPTANYQISKRVTKQLTN